MNRTDILQDNDGDIAISGGDILIGNGSKQQQRDIIIARKGDFKNMLGIGVCASDYLLEDDASDMLREVRKNLEKDSFKVEKVSMENGKLKTVVE